MKVGLSSKQIEQATTTDQVDWQREIAWQIAKLREEQAERFERLLNRMPE